MKRKRAAAGQSLVTLTEALAARDYVPSKQFMNEYGIASDSSLLEILPRSLSLKPTPTHHQSTIHCSIGNGAFPNGNSVTPFDGLGLGLSGAKAGSA